MDLTLLKELALWLCSRLQRRRKVQASQDMWVGIGHKNFASFEVEKHATVYMSKPGKEAREVR